MNNKQFFKVYYETLQNNDLNLCEKIVYSILDSQSKFYDVCYISNTRISEISSISETTIKRVLIKLKAKGYIATWKMKKGKKVYRAITTNKIFVEDKDKLNQLKIAEHQKEFIDYDWLNERDWYYERNKNL